MAHKAPGKSHRRGITLMQLADMFPDEDSARRWFESRIWLDGRECPRCGSKRTVEASHKYMPYWCSDCRKYFSVRTGTVLERSKIPLRKWVYAIYLHLTSLKGVSSVKLHRDIGVSQPCAWFMLQRIRKAFESNDDDDDPPFGGPIEVDETYIGGKETNKHARDKLKAGRGTVGKVAVIGAKDRETNEVQAKVIPAVDLMNAIPFVRSVAEMGATVYTDEARVYLALPTKWGRVKHEAVKHSAGEYVQGDVHTNGIESFWSMLKRGYVGVYHKMSPKHLNRYVQEFVARHCIRNVGTMMQMSIVANLMAGKRLTYQQLIADNGLPSGARSTINGRYSMA